MENPAITVALNKFIDELKLRGAKIIEIKIPELEEARVAHMITIGSEHANTTKRYKSKMHSFSLPTRMNMNVMKLFTSSVSIINFIITFIEIYLILTLIFLFLGLWWVDK